MKFFTSFLLANAFFGVSMTSQAAERGLEEMRAAAAQILNDRESALSIGLPARARAINEMQDIMLLDAKSEMSVLGYADGGFAIISRDDRLPAVLAYCEGDYKRALENPNFVSYVSTFDDYLKYCAEQGIEPKFINKAATFNPEGVKEIMTCKWDQGGPYNYMCPFVYKEGSDGKLDDRRCITGCVATAQAMILYTLVKQQGANIRLRGAKYYYYIDDNKQLAFEWANLGNIRLDWENMRDTYSATTGHTQNMAVARLMYASGVASEMIYSTGASGTYTSIAGDGINTFFEGVKSEYSGYGIEPYEQRIYDELDAGRPIMLSGANAENGGHCFVGDGYDKQGRLHINLGWSGGGNGFFTIADMAGFASAQTANFITPVENDALVLSKDEPLDELRGKYATADIAHPAEAIIEGQWYVLYNKGRYSSAYSTGAGKTIQNSSYIPVTDPSETVAPMLVRFIPKDANKYYIQTGTGDYFGALSYGSNYGSDRNPSHLYTCGKIQEKKTQKYFWFKQGSTVLDCNATGGQGIAGWGNTTPTDTLGHSCWMLLPVTFSDTAELPTLGNNRFNSDHRYVLVNYDGAKNYYFNLKATCSINSKNPTELRLTRGGGGWIVSSFEDENLVWSVKSKDFKTGNGATASDEHITLSFEPTGETVDTGNEFLDACSAFYRIRTETGYVATEKVALGATVFCNKGVHAEYGRWLLIDQTELDEMLLEGIENIDADALAGQKAEVYDLLGRRVAAPQSGHLYIENGKKTIR